MKRTTRRSAVGSGILAVSLAWSATAVADVSSSTATGPSTSVSPYILPAAPGVHITSLLTVNDQPAGNGVPMVGIPDGLGAFAEGGNMVVLMNHELASNLGVVRAHGQPGAFVSRNVIDPETGEVLESTDLIRTVRYWDYQSGMWGSAPTGGFGAALNRFCSASLTDPGQLYDAASGTGYRGQIYFANEEDSSQNANRDFGVTMDGVATQLPRMGLFSYENTLVASGTGRATVALATEDGAAGDTGQLRIYVGEKQANGAPVERAGLTNGTLHVLDAADTAVTTDTGWRATYATGTAHPVTANEVDWNQAGPVVTTDAAARGDAQNAEAAAQGLSMNRIEDGAFDPLNPNDFYFATTEGGDKTPAPGAGSPSRDGGGLWRLRFADVSDPSQGMTLELLLDGSEPPYLNKPDNMGFDRHGHLLLQEDPGDNAHLARIVAYRVEDGARGVVAEFDPALFTSGLQGFMTANEESSGIIDVSQHFGQKTFLFDAQVHTAAGLSNVVRDVRHGQLLLLRVKSWGQVFNDRG